MHVAFLRSLVAFAVLALCGALPVAARAADYTDLWWALGGVESGWGVNLVQNEDVVFATFYIHDTAKKPIWFSAAMFVTSTGAYSGTLRYSTGSFFGGAWNPADVDSIPVGTATFTPTSAPTGTLSYSVNGAPGIPNVVVTKLIQRSTFRTIVLGGNYAGTGVVTVTGCTDASKNGTSLFDVDPQVTQTTGGALTISLSFGSSETCTLSGAAVQEGTLFRMSGASYVCTSGTATTLSTAANVYEVKATSLGIEGRWAANTGGACVENGTFSGVLM